MNIDQIEKEFLEQEKTLINIENQGLDLNNLENPKIKIKVNTDKVFPFFRTQITKLLEEVIEKELTNWLKEYANRPLDKRKNPFDEVVDLRNFLKDKYLK